MDIGHNDINGILHLPYDTMLQKLPGIISEITRAIEVNKNKIRVVGHRVLTSTGPRN
jgi:hypothetical protein